MSVVAQPLGGDLDGAALQLLLHNIAAANGDEYAPAEREIQAQYMTPRQIADAQTRARVCMSSGYQDCD